MEVTAQPTLALRSGRRGFSLIELLVVIAIIAIVAALTFPLAAGLRESGNATSCAGNLQNIGQALRLYRLDERAYPPALYGYQENGITDPDTGLLKPTTFLYPHYIRSTRDFKCPDNPRRFNEFAYSNVFEPTGTDPQKTVPQKKVPTANGKSYTLAPVTTKEIVYFSFDSYDGGYVPPKSTSAMYQLHYRPDWAELPLNAAQQTRELLNRNPEDGTYVTVCTYHRVYNGDGSFANGSSDIVLFQDGHTEKRPSADFTAAQWLVAPTHQQS